MTSNARERSRLAREIAHWRAVSDRTDGLWGWSTPSGRIRLQRRAVMLAEGVRMRPGDRILELGCGTGPFTRVLRTYGAAMVAIDVSEPLISRAREQLADVVFVLGDACALPFADGSFDGVVGSSVLHHLNVDAALGEIHRVLRRGGSAAFTEPNMLNPQVALQKNVPVVKRWLGDSPDETAFFAWDLAARFKAAGFVASVEPFDFLHPHVPPTFAELVLHLGAWIERLPVVRHLAGSLYVRATRT